MQYSTESNEIAARYESGEKLDDIAAEKGMTKQAIHAKIRRRHDWEAIRTAHFENKRERRQEEISRLCVPCDKKFPMKPQQQYCCPECYYAAKVDMTLGEWLEEKGIDPAGVEAAA